MGLHIDILKVLEDWCQKVERALELRTGRDLCEATRMILSILFIVDSYSPTDVTPERCKRVEELFEQALLCVTEELAAGNNPDGCYDLYEYNIQDRITDFEHLIVEEHLARTKD